MKIIGRRSEQKELELCEKSKKSELVCVYGRRRVGKTFLIEQTYGNYFAFRATGLEKGSTRQQLRAFNQRLMECGDDVKTIPKNWFEAFSRLDKVLSKENVLLSPHNKKIVFLDEFPWFATQKSDFLLAFEDFWNRRGTQEGNFVFVICGSATSWIIKNVLDDTGNLYHRVTRQIFLSPFTLAESEQFFRDRDFDWSREQIMEFYMVFGGLPFFMDLLNANESFNQNVDRLLFKPGALLRGETNRLLEATLSKSPAYGQVLQLLSKRNYGMKKSACQSESGISSGTFSRIIEDLLKCGYIVEYKRNYEKGNPLYIQLVDPFLLFHYHFMHKEESISCYDDLTHNTGLFMNWRGHAFEVLCMHHIPQIKMALGISGVKTKCFQWENKEQKDNVQIDLVIEREDKITNICEIKCTEHPFAISREYDQMLIRKREVFREKTATKNALKLIMISATGIAGLAHTEHIADVVTLDDLFAS
mgnify:CR=1 FL=1